MTETTVTTKNASSATVKSPDYDDLLRPLSLPERRRVADRLIAGAMGYEAWKIGVVLGNGAAHRSASERLELARTEEIFHLVGKMKDRAGKSALVTDLAFRLAIDVDLVEEEVEAAAPNKLDATLKEIEEEARKNAGPSFKEGKALWRSQAVSIWEWFTKKGGRFFYDVEAERALLFWNQKVRPLAVSDPELMGTLWKLAKFNAQDPSAKWIVTELSHMANAQGIRVHRHSWIHTDKLSRVVYLNLCSADGSILKLHDGKVDVIPNGSNDDEILLADPLYAKSFTFVPDPSEDDAALAKLGELVCKNIASSRIDALYSLCWAFCSLIPSFTSAQSIVHFQGQQGSGKTGAAKLFWTLLYGDENITGAWTVAALKAAGEQMPFIPIDDVGDKQMRDALVQHLKISATGGGAAKRSAGTEKGLTSSQAGAFIAITGIMPFEQSDLRERMVSIEIKKKWQAPGWVEGLTMQELLGWRDRILSAIFRKLAGMIGEVEEQRDTILYMKKRFPNWSKNRMDEFTALVVMLMRRIAEPLGHCDGRRGDSARPVSVDELLFGSTAAASLAQHGSFLADAQDQGDFVAFVKEQDRQAKEFDRESSPGVEWMSHLFAPFMDALEEGTFGSDYKEKELGLRGVVIDLGNAVGHGGVAENLEQRQWRYVEIVCTGAAMHRAIKLMAKTLGLAASCPFTSTMSLSKKLQNEGTPLGAAGIFIEQNVGKTSGGDRLNRYRKRLGKLDEVTRSLKGQQEEIL